MQIPFFLLIPLGQESYIECHLNILFILCMSCVIQDSISIQNYIKKISWLFQSYFQALVSVLYFIWNTLCLSNHIFACSIIMLTLSASLHHLKAFWYYIKTKTKPTIFCGLFTHHRGENICAIQHSSMAWRETVHTFFKVHLKMK